MMPYDKKQFDAYIREIADAIRFAEQNGYESDAREALFQMKAILRELRDASEKP